MGPNGSTYRGSRGCLVVLVSRNLGPLTPLQIGEPKLKLLPSLLESLGWEWGLLGQQRLVRASFVGRGECGQSKRWDNALSSSIPLQ